MCEDLGVEGGAADDDAAAAADDATDAGADDAAGAGADDAAVVAAAGLPGLAACTGRHLPTVLHLIRGGPVFPAGAEHWPPVAAWLR